MGLPRRTFLHIAATFGTFVTIARAAHALDYPTRPVHLIVGIPAGTAPDIVARLAGKWLSEHLDQPFIIENRLGAGSNIAAEMVVRAPPDGYTLLLESSTNTINATLYDKLNFDFIRDIAPVVCICRIPFVMVVNPSVPAKTIPEFIAYAKANPGKINYVSPGVGTTPHVFGAMFNMMTGIDMVHVPYRGPYIPDLLAGQVQVTFVGIPTVIEYARAGKLRALGVTSATRAEALPGIPPVGEFVSGYEASGWLGAGAPKDTPSEIIETLSTQLRAAVANPDIKARFAALSIEPMPMMPSEFAKFIADDAEKWARVIKFAKIRPN